MSAMLRVAALVIGLGIPALVAQTLHRQYVQALASAETRAANTARALEQHAARTIEGIDAYLRAVVALVGPRAGDVAPDVVHAALREQVARTRYLNNLMVIDRDGRGLFEAESFPARPLDVSDRDYFQTLRDAPDAPLVVGKVVTGRLTGKRVLPMARRMENADGSFAGIIQATLDPEAFQTVYDVIDNGPGATLNLWREDGVLLLRSPHLPGLIGRSYAATENYRQHVPARDAKPFWSHGATDGVERVIGFGFLEGYPLYVSAAVARADALAEWYGAASVQAGVAGGVTLVLVCALLLLAREVTRRRVADALIRKSEARYRLLSESTTDMVTQMDASGRRLFVSPASRHLLGYAPDELVGTRPQDAIHPDDAGSLTALLAALAAGEHARATHINRLRHRDGHWVWVEASLTRMQDAGGRFSGIVAAVRDISARKAAEAAAAESEARYREVLDASRTTILGQLAEGVIATDAAGRITLVNEAAATIHGVARLDVEPDAYSDSYHLFTEDWRPYPSHELPLARAVRGETVSDARWRVRRPDGTDVLAIGCARPVRGRDGAQIGAVLTLRDDTAREAAERALRDLNATLSQRVAARTREAETAQAEAETAQAEAERASAAKSEFLAAMSHEIRTPLNGILGYADLLLEEPALTAAARRHGERIQSAGSALLTVVNDILDFSKIEAGQIELAPEPFALAGLIDDATAIVRASAERKGLRLDVAVDSSLPDVVVGDRDRLRQVLLNLLNNAIKFTRAGSVTLEVAASGGGASGAADGRAALRFAVRDTGIGIPRAKQHLLFERFSQIDGTIQREFGGTGLGLAICRRLIDLMQGTIGVESEEGRGATFWFRLDLPVAARAASPGIAQARAARGGGRRLLLAEDVPLNQELACTILRKAGYAVDVVENGAEALRAVQAQPYDLVLMDVQMPTMDGITATRRIRALDHAAAAVPIVALTANVLPQQVATFRAAGMCDHVGKPFKREALVAAVERWTREPAAGQGRDPGRDPASDGAQTPDGEGLDREVFDEMVALLGRAGVDRLLGGLSEELGRRLGADGAPLAREALARDAHAIVSASGALGFRALSELCREAERACAAGEAHEALVRRLQALRSSTIREIAALRAA